MDFFIKASYAAATQSPPATGAFFDEYRVVIMSLSLLLSVIVFIWQIIKHFQDKKANKKSYSLSIAEGYWHQSVVLPLFVDKFVSSVTQWIDEINKPNKSNDEIIGIRDSFKKDIRELNSRTQLLCTVEEQARTNIRAQLEDIEDSVISYLSEASDNKKEPPNDKVFKKSEAIFKELMNDHQRFNQ